MACCENHADSLQVVVKNRRCRNKDNSENTNGAKRWPEGSYIRLISKCKWHFTFVLKIELKLHLQ